MYINDIIVNHTDKPISYSNDKNAVITQTDKSVSYNSYKVSKDIKYTYSSVYLVYSNRKKV